MMHATILLAFLGFKSVTGSPWYPGRSSFNWENTNFLLAFGDSYTFVHGTEGRQNFSFIGDAQDFSFTPKELLENKIIQDQLGTSAGGPNWVEYLTGCFVGLPSKCEKQLWDFAFAGADVSTEYLPLHHDYTIPLVDQVLQWATYAQSVIPVTLSRTLVATFIGINDINDSSKYTFPRGNATDFPSFYKQVIAEEFEALETVYGKGYRNFLFMNLPPLDRTPGAVVVGSAARPNTTMIKQWNSQLSASALEFSRHHPDTRVMVFDTYEYLSQILDKPDSYGFKNATGYCANYNAPDISTNYALYGCLPIEQYFWYNSGHITWKVHEFLAAEVDKFLRRQSGL